MKSSGPRSLLCGAGSPPRGVCYSISHSGKKLATRLVEQVITSRYIVARNAEDSGRHPDVAQVAGTMKVWSSGHTLDQPWETVPTAAKQKYPPL